MRAREFIFEQFLVELSEESQLRAIARFEAEQKSKLDRRKKTQIQRCVELWSKHGSGDIFQLSFDQAYQIVDNNLLKQELKGRAKEQLDPDDNPNAEPDYENLAPEDSDLIIYLGNSKKKCIAYGDGYSFCISRKDGSNVYDRYRNELYKTFYFVRNPDKPESDNTHLIVINVDRQGNFAYTLAHNPGGDVKIGRDWKQIEELEPELANLEHLFVYVEPSEEEARRYRLATTNFSLEEYRNLSARDKFIRGQSQRGLSPTFQDATVVEGDPVLSQLLIGAYVKRHPDDFTARSWKRLSKGDQRYVRKLVDREFQADAMKYLSSMFVIYGKDHFSKDELIKLLENQGHLLISMIRAGVDIDEDLQIAAILNSPHVIFSILSSGIRPSDRVQLFLVSTFPSVIEDILKAQIVPSDEVQYVAIEKRPEFIQYILNAGIRPSDRVQLAAVKQDHSLIINILESNFTPPIIPSDRVQMAAIERRPELIRNILRAGIRPSDRVQMAAVDVNSLLIIDIFDADLTPPPSEAVQIAAVTIDPGLLKSIQAKGITLSPRVVNAAKEAIAKQHEEDDWFNDDDDDDDDLWRF